MSRYRSGAAASASYNALGVVVLFGAALLLVACQALGLPRSLGFGEHGSAGDSPQPAPSRPPATATAVPTRAVATPTPAASTGTNADARMAAAVVGRYLDALTNGRYGVAWQLLAPSARTAWQSERQFRTERAAFYATAGPRFVVAAPDHTAETLDDWLPRTFDGDRARAYVIAVDHPALSSNAAREMLVAAPTVAGEWRIWIGR